MPFKLTFGTEAVIPVEVGLTSLRVKTYEGQKNQQELNINLDLIDEVKEEAAKQMTEHKEAMAAMARYYNIKVKVRRFNTGDLVIRKISQAMKDLSQRKLGLAWEGPYEVLCRSKEGSYYLKSLDGLKLPRLWNIEHLKKYY